MSLWGRSDANTSAPKYMAFSGLGVSANGNVLFSNVQVGAFHANCALGVDGITDAEKANTAGPQHSGWVSRIVGTGYLKSVEVTNGGTGYTPGTGYLTFNGGSSGSGANVSYQVNAAGSVANVTINSPGANYNVAVTANTVVAYTVKAIIPLTFGGRTGRVQYETLVAGHVV